MQSYADRREVQARLNTHIAENVDVFREAARLNEEFKKLGGEGDLAAWDGSRCMFFFNLIRR